MCGIQEDRRLDALRYRLVPSKLAEPVFWRRYFALVAQVRQDILGSVVTEHDDLVHVPHNPECSLAGGMHAEPGVLTRRPYPQSFDHAGHAAGHVMC